jgi:hypothetical protein
MGIELAFASSGREGKRAGEAQRRVLERIEAKRFTTDKRI